MLLIKPDFTHWPFGRQRQEGGMMKSKIPAPVKEFGRPFLQSDDAAGIQKKPLLHFKKSNHRHNLHYQTCAAICTCLTLLPSDCPGTLTLSATVSHLERARFLLFLLRSTSLQRHHSRGTILDPAFGQVSSKIEMKEMEVVKEQSGRRGNFERGVGTAKRGHR